MTLVSAIRDLDPATYTRSPLHADDRLWPEKNCYIDIWIEVLHALRLEPLAMSPFVYDMDFEGDQWTFFKPSHGELYDLYGVDVQELTVWRPLLDHALEHLPAGKLISTEADAFWLPDTAGTDYRRNHVKTTIVMNAVDPDARVLDYFHNASYHRLTGEDFDHQFRIGYAPDPSFLPLYAEFVRTDRIVRREPTALAKDSLALLRRHLERRPGTNPIGRFAARFEADLPLLQQKGLEHYHLWAFVNLRQLGAATEIAAMHLRWLGAVGALDVPDAAVALEEVSGTCKSLILKGARAVNARRALDIRTPCDLMAARWSEAVALLERAI